MQGGSDLARRFPLSVFLFGAGQWVCILLVLVHLRLNGLGLLIVFTLMTATFELLKVRVGRFNMSVGALISYLNLAVTTVPAAVLAKVLGMAIAAAVNHRTHHEKWFNPFMNIGNLGVTVTAAGFVYHLLHGSGANGQVLALPYLAMAFTYVVANVLLIALPRALAERRLPWQPALDILARSWPNLSVFVVTGLLLQVLYQRFQPLQDSLGILFIFAILLVVRFTVQLYGERLGFREEMVDTLSRVLNFKDPYTAAHSTQVADYSVLIGQAMGYSEKSLSRLYDSALLHDIGKVAVPDAVLSKPSALDASEHETMARHVGAGSDLLARSPHLRELANLVGGHHLFFAVGTGTNVPLESRIIAVADAFDAMTTDRPYRKALPVSEAVRRLREAEGTQFDPEVVAVLLRVLGLNATNLDED